MAMWCRTVHDVVCVLKTDIYLNKRKANPVTGLGLVGSHAEQPDQLEQSELVKELIQQHTK